MYDKLTDAPVREVYQYRTSKKSEGITEEHINGSNTKRYRCSRHK